MDGGKAFYYPVTPGVCEVISRLLGRKHRSKNNVFPCYFLILVWFWFIFLHQVKEDKGFHVYTLHVKAESNTFDVYIDTELVSTGNLLEDFEPAVNPPKEIDDADDEQPKDWITEVQERFACGRLGG